VVPGPDYNAANRRKASITARAAGFTVLPVSGGRLRQADLFQVLPGPGTPRFGYQPHSFNNDVGKRFFEGRADG